MSNRTVQCSIGLLLMCSAAGTTWAGFPSAFPLYPQSISPALMDEYNQAWVLIKQRRPNDAVPILKKIIEKDKNFHRAYKALVDAYNQKNDLGSAEQYFNALLNQDRTTALAYYGLGIVSDAEGHPELAAEYYTSCIQQEPQAYVCYVPMTDALVSLAKRNQAVVGVGTLRERVSADTGSPYWDLTLAEFYLAQRRLPEALRAAKLGLEKAPTLAKPELETAFHIQLDAACALTPGAEKDRLDQSLALLKIAEDLDDWPSEFEYRGVLGWQYEVMGNAEQADTFMQANLAFARRTGSLELEAESLSALGSARKLTSQLDEALQYYQDARRAYEQLGDTNITVLLDIGKTYGKQGDYPAALEWTEKARQTAVETRNSTQEAFALSTLGALHGQMGENFKALEDGKESVRIFDELDMRPQAAAVRGNLANSYATLGDYDEARKCAEQALRGAQKNSDPGEEERALAILGSINFEENRTREGVRDLERALVFSTNRSLDTYFFRSGILLSLGSAYARQGRYNRAIAMLDDGLTIIRRTGSIVDEADCLGALGDSYLGKGDLNRAEEYLNLSLEIAEPRDLAEVVLEDRRGWAEVERRKGQYEQSLQQLRLAIGTLETMRSGIPSPDLREDFVQQNSKVYQDAVDILAELDRQQPARDYDRQAFYYAEKGRARSFQDLLAESAAKVTKGLRPEQIQRRDALYGDLSKAAAALLRKNSEENRQAVTKAEGHLSDWADGLRSTNSAYHELQYPESYNAAKVQIELAGSGTTIIEYALGERESHLWIVTHDRLKMVTLPRRDVIEKAVSAYRELINRRPSTQADVDAFVKPAKHLYEVLVQPVSRYLKKGQGLVIVPDGGLWYLPFETLVEPGTSGTAPNQPHYLIEDYAITYAPSASVFGDLQVAANERRKQPDLRRHGLLAYGDPVFSRATVPQARDHSGTSLSGDEIVRSVYQQAASIHFYPLPMTRDEVVGIGEFYRPDQRKLRLGPEATEASVKHDRLTDYRIIHFATHSVMDEETPAMSGVVLSLVNTGDEDGVLRMNEIFNLDLDADLVVLSACPTGLGKLMRGEGMVGLTRAFMYAGSPRVVVSLWEVNDMATPEFMKAFYKGLTHGDTTTAALRRAKLAMLKSDTPAYHHPYFWAPFVLVGLQ
jgi:CHAT domain-containing protein/lipopolysaccharide biosynthesis regulator YciM